MARRASAVDIPVPKRKTARKISLPNNSELLDSSRSSLSIDNGGLLSLSTSQNSISGSPGRKKTVRFSGHMENTTEVEVEMEEYASCEDFVVPPPKNGNRRDSESLAVGDAGRRGSAAEAPNVCSRVPSSEEFRKVADSMRSINNQFQEHLTSQ